MAKIKSPCAIEGCQKPSRTRGWCSAHYERVRVHGDPGTRTIGDRKNHCSMPDCDQTAYGHGYCSKHYNRFVRHGSPLVTLRVAGDPIDRFWHYVQKGADPSSCWLWTGGLNQDGYGVSTMNKKFLRCAPIRMEIAARGRARRSGTRPSVPGASLCQPRPP